MNIIQEKTIFDYMEIEILGDLERLKLFLENPLGILYSFLTHKNIIQTNIVFIFRLN